jgi:hypothetical protein
MAKSVYDYLQPTPKQIETMQALREAAMVYGVALAELLPDGPDKTWAIRNHRRPKDALHPQPLWSGAARTLSHRTR